MARNKRSPKARGVSRYGSVSRRKLEFETILDQITRLRERFIARLEKRLIHEANGCKRYRATCSDGYPLIAFRYEGKMIVMKAHRVFAILRNCAPIPLGMDVGHLPHCKNRDCVAHTVLQTVQENASQANRSRL